MIPYAAFPTCPCLVFRFSCSPGKDFRKHLCLFVPALPPPLPAVWPVVPVPAPFLSLLPIPALQTFRHFQPLPHTVSMPPADYFPPLKPLYTLPPALSLTAQSWTAPAHTQKPPPHRLQALCTQKFFRQYLLSMDFHVPENFCPQCCGSILHCCFRFRNSYLFYCEWK